MDTGHLGVHCTEVSDSSPVGAAEYGGNTSAGRVRQSRVLSCRAKRPSPLSRRAKRPSPLSRRAEPPSPLSCRAKPPSPLSRRAKPPFSLSCRAKRSGVETSGREPAVSLFVSRNHRPVSTFPAGGWTPISGYVQGAAGSLRSGPLRGPPVEMTEERARPPVEMTETRGMPPLEITETRGRPSVEMTRSGNGSRSATECRPLPHDMCD
jgi:hypothetical protein